MLNVLLVEEEKTFIIRDNYNNNFKINAFSVGEIVDIIQHTFKNGEFIIDEISTETGEILNHFEFNNK